jgi:GNAT superfamily N-acetyltransferase
VDENGVGAGLVAAILDEEPSLAHLAAMWAHPAKRGQGVGDALVAAVVRWAADQNRRVRLHVVEDNAPAVALYERHGFRRTGTSAFVSTGCAARRRQHYVRQMEQRVSLITLGADVRLARAFYERLGWQGQEVEETVFFQLGAVALVLWGRAKLALDAAVEDEGATTFGRVALAHNVRSRTDVDLVLAEATAAGAVLTRPAENTSYGGTPGTSVTWTDTCGRSHTTPDSRSLRTGQSPFRTSGRLRPSR